MKKDIKNDTKEKIKKMQLLTNDKSECKKLAQKLVSYIQKNKK